MNKLLISEFLKDLDITDVKNNGKNLRDINYFYFNLLFRSKEEKKIYFSSDDKLFFQKYLIRKNNLQELQIMLKITNICSLDNEFQKYFLKNNQKYFFILIYF